MILRMNGQLLEPSGSGFMDKMNDFADHFISKEAEFIVNPFLEFLKSGALTTVHGLTEIMPELAVFIAILCIGIGMFGSFGKWVLRAGCVYAGGATWIILATSQ